MRTRLRAAEFVFPGHPDKLCDAIADAIVAEGIRREQRALVGVEVAVHRHRVFVTGRVACKDATDIDVARVVRDVYRSAGYGPGWPPSPAELVVDTALCLGPLEDGEAELREVADDQAVCIGYANDLAETNALPVEQWLVARLARRLHALREQIPALRLGPDGKVLVVVAERPSEWSLADFTCSIQQHSAADGVALHREVRRALEEELQAVAVCLPGFSPALPEQLTVNGAGAFEVGGPEGDNGLSGKKLVMDAYGPRIPVGGGAWSGKDFHKADRAGGMHARRFARFVVELGLASEARVTLGWFPGDREARVLGIETPPGQDVAVRRLARCLDSSLRMSGECFAAGELVDVARWGHFTDPVHPWETVGRL